MNIINCSVAPWSWNDLQFFCGKNLNYLYINCSFTEFLAKEWAYLTAWNTPKIFTLLFCFYLYIHGDTCELIFLIIIFSVNGLHKKANF